MLRAAWRRFPPSQMRQQVTHTRNHHAIANNMLEPAMTVQVFKQLEDNFSFLVRDEANMQCFMVDACDGPASLHAVKSSSQDCEFTTLLTTHKHW